MNHHDLQHWPPSWPQPRPHAPSNATPNSAAADAASAGRRRQATVRRRRTPADHHRLPATGLLHDRAGRPAGGQPDLHRQRRGRPAAAGRARPVTPTTLRFSSAQTCWTSSTRLTSAPSRPRMPEVLSDPALTGMSRQELQQLTQRLAPGRPPTPNGAGTSDGAANGFPAPEEASSGRRSPTANESWQPSCPTRRLHPEVLADLLDVSRSPSATRSGTSARSWNKTATPSPLPDDDSLPRQRFWTS